MNWIKSFLLSLILFTLTSCSTLLHFFQDDEVDLNLNKKTEKTFCEDTKIQVASSEEMFAQISKVINAKIAKISPKLNFAEKSTLYTLTLFRLAPHLATPQSRLQIYYLNNEKIYLDFSKKDPMGSPGLYGLNHFLKLNKTNRSLKELASYLDSWLSPIQLSSSELSNFLLSKKAQVDNNLSLKKIFTKGGQLVQKNESYPITTFNQTFEIFPIGSLKNYEMVNELQSFTINNQNIECNFDIESYHKGKISPSKEELQATYVAYAEDNKFFLAAFSQNNEKINSAKKSHFIIGTNQSVPIPFCKYENNEQNLSLFVSHSRDPAQHMSYLLGSAIDAKKPNDLIEFNHLFQSARFLVLPKPTRIIFESNKADKNQLEQILKSLTPVYQSWSLGQFFGHASFNDKKSLMIDHRYVGSLECL